MAKRVRGTTSRPGQRRPLQRTTPRPAKPSAPVSEVVARPSDELTDAEEARAAELEAAIVAEERQAEESHRITRTTRATESAAPNRAPSSLATSAAEEYAYVARDVRRIAIVGGSLVAVLIVLWIASHALGFTI
jgi:hypothetical protein